MVQTKSKGSLDSFGENCSLGTELSKGLKVRRVMKINGNGVLNVSEVTIDANE